MHWSPSSLLSDGQPARNGEFVWASGATWLRLRLWAHTLGYRGHWATRSRRYSTTLKALRKARRQWHHDTNGGSGADPCPLAPGGSLDAATEPPAMRGWPERVASRGRTSGARPAAIRAAVDLLDRCSA